MRFCPLSLPFLPNWQFPKIQLRRRLSSVICNCRLQDFAVQATNLRSSDDVCQINFVRYNDCTTLEQRSVSQIAFEVRARNACTQQYFESITQNVSNTHILLSESEPETLSHSNISIQSHVMILVYTYCFRSEPDTLSHITVSDQWWNHSVFQMALTSTVIEWGGTEDEGIHSCHGPMAA